MHGLKSEMLKYKRTFMRRLVVFIPLFFTVYAVIMHATLMKHPLSENSRWMWQSLLALVYNWWPLAFLPLGFALFATLAAAQEKNPAITAPFVLTMYRLRHSGQIRLPLCPSTACFLHLY